jgi:iron complex outermembrane recepter protein
MITERAPRPARTICASLLACVPIAAFAQTAESDVGAALQEIIVTAQKRGENLQNVPISVAVVNAAELQARGIASTGDLSGLTPGLVSTSAEGFSLPYLRGIGTGTDDAGVSSPIAIYVDGVYIDSPAASLFSMNNIDQIEIDKGPQGTLFGRNATGGVIQITTKDPSQNFGGKLSVSDDNYQTIVTDLYVTGGIAKDLAADLAFHYSDQIDGWGKNFYTGLDEYRGREYDIRSKWLWTPTEHDRVTVAFDYEHMNDLYGVLDYLNGTKSYDFGLSGIQVKTGSPYDTYQSIQQPHTLEEGGVSVKVQHDFELAVLNSISAARYAKNDATYTFSLPPFDIAGLIGNVYRQFTQEVQLSSASSNHIKWVAGAFYMRAVSLDDPYVAGQHGTDAIPGGAFGFPPLPAGVAPTLGANTFGTITTSTQTTNSSALYGQTTAEISEQTNLTVGLRYTHENASIFGVDPNLGPIASHGATFNEPTWRLGVDHHFNSDLMGYVSYSRGFKAGTFDDNTPADPATKPEKLDAYEMGVKGEYLDKRLRINAAGFYYNYTNIVEPIAATVNNVVVLKTTNGPKAELYGLDFDSVLEVTNHLRLSLSVEALHSEFTQFNGATFFQPIPTGGVSSYIADATGNHLPVAPNFTSNLTASYTLPTSTGDYRLSASWDHNSGWYADIQNRVKQDPFEMVTAQIGWNPPGANWRVALWGRNLTDSLVLARALIASPFGTLGTYQAPRTFGGRFECSF